MRSRPSRSGVPGATAASAFVMAALRRLGTARSYLAATPRLAENVSGGPGDPARRPLRPVSPRGSGPDLPADREPSSARWLDGTRAAPLLGAGGRRARLGAPHP